MLTVALGLASAFVSGGADFLGGIASKRLNAMYVTALAALSGFALLLLASVFLDGRISQEAVIWGALSGVFAATGIALLYGCLAIGPMSILSPITAVVSAAVPMFGGLLEGERLQPLGYGALGIALVAVVLVGIVPDSRVVRPKLKGLLMALGSGLSIGMLLILLDMTPADSGLVPLVFNRAGNAVTMGVVITVVLIVAKRRKRRTVPIAESVSVSVSAAVGPVAVREQADWQPEAKTTKSPLSIRRARPWWVLPVALSLVAGIVDGTANIALLTGMRVGELTIMSVLNALYPAGTIILAAVLLRERIAPVQTLGLVLAIIAAALLALA
jgi:drug/metabolite transporter (DMT)-like permease